MSPDAKRSEADAELDTAAGEDAGEAPDLASLRASGDAQGLLALAKARRAARDMKGCLEAYRAAAELGSAEAEFASALFYMTGGVVAQDLKEGAARLRSAAEKGSIPARVYVGNLYELGIHYKADAEKADVWYRNAARAAKVEAEPGTSEYVRELAELGCVRHVLALVNEAGGEAAEHSVLTDEEKARLLQRAKVHGHGLKIRDESDPGRMSGELRGERLTFAEGLDAAGAVAADANANAATAKATSTASATSAATPAGGAMKAAPAAKGKPQPAGPDRRAGLAAFGYALLFVLAGLGAAYAAMAGARELVAGGHALPGLGDRTHLVFPIVLGVVGVLPAWLVYRLSAVTKALVAGAAMGGVGWVAWGTGQGALHAVRGAQAIAFGLAGFLAALLVLGLLGGSKLGQKTRRPARPSGGSLK